MNRKTLAILGIFIVIILVIVAVALNSPSPFNEKVADLENAGYTVQAYDVTFAEAKAERPGVTFTETTSWDIFKQQVSAAKQDIGFVTVWTHENEQILWVARYETTYYYYIAK